MKIDPTHAQAPVLPASLRVSTVELTVTDLDRSVAFYESAIGLRLHRRENGRAAVGAGGGTRVVDEVAFAPRLRAAGGLQALVFEAAFRWRHRRLRSIWGSR